jgi:hypothetical protein
MIAASNYSNRRARIRLIIADRHAGTDITVPDRHPARVSQALLRADALRREQHRGYGTTLRFQPEVTAIQSQAGAAAFLARASVAPHAARRGVRLGLLITSSMPARCFRPNTGEVNT